MEKIKDEELLRDLFNQIQDEMEVHVCWTEDEKKESGYEDQDDQLRDYFPLLWEHIRKIS